MRKNDKKWGNIRMKIGLKNGKKWVNIRMKIGTYIGFFVRKKVAKYKNFFESKFF